jgi:hypothetical protein
MMERRRDPRTSKPYSLANLLRTRAVREGWLIAVVGDASGLIMGSSRDPEDRQSERIAAHVSDLCRGGRTELVREARSSPGVRLLATRIDAGGGPVTVTILVDERARSSDVAALAACVNRILREPPRAAASLEAAA